jgi:hypothetical protein
MRTIVRAAFVMTVAALFCLAFGQTSSEGQRRNVTVEEASDLLYAYLESRGCTTSSCSVGQIHDTYFSGCYSFSAMWNNHPHGSPVLGYFKVDPRTGHVWDGVMWRSLTSPSLVKLQQVIRKRIGLSDEENQKTPRNAPMCEPDQKPGVARGE